MSSGKYEEPLPCGGTLSVTTYAWQIQYYFPGPDLRYNGTFVYLPGDSIELYITGLFENWSEYKQLKTTIPQGGEFSKVGRMGMTIQIGSYSEGVCLQSYYMPISSRQHLDIVVGSWRYAAKRGSQIQIFLKSL